MIAYTEVKLILDPDWNDIVMAELGEVGYDSFVETEDGLSAYIPQENFDPYHLETLAGQYPDANISYQIEKLETVNWNEEWERNYQPIEVAHTVRIHASFHEPDVGFKHNIVIDPKMSFGTGHHETTSMMIAQQLEIDHDHKKVLDVGSGTGILAILAAKLGASEVLGFDIEEWAYLNAIENIEINHCDHVSMFRGTINDCTAAQYDIVLANINRNILLEEIPKYVQFLKPEGVLLVSGFYEKDRVDIAQKAAESGLTQVSYMNNNDWACVKFARIDA